MSRLEETSCQSIKTFQYFTPSYREIIAERDRTIYNENNGSEWDNFEYVINKYSGSDFKRLNDYLREGIVSGGYSERRLKSCLDVFIVLYNI